MTVKSIVDKTKAAKAARAKALLKSASGAAKQLESDVAELVAMRAWEVLGYQDFAEMWRQECGFSCPAYVRVLLIKAIEPEMNTLKCGNLTNGLTSREVAKMIGNGSQSSISNILAQLRSGVSPDAVRSTVSRTRSQVRITGAAPDDLVNTGFVLPLRDAKAVEAIARAERVPNAEIYRRAVAEYLAHNVKDRPRLSTRKS